MSMISPLAAHDMMAIPVQALNSIRWKDHLWITDEQSWDKNVHKKRHNTLFNQRLCLFIPLPYKNMDHTLTREYEHMSK